MFTLRHTSTIEERQLEWARTTEPSYFGTHGELRCNVGQCSSCSWSVELLLSLWSSVVVPVGLGEVAMDCMHFNALLSFYFIMWCCV